MRQKDLQNAEKFIMKHRLYRRWIIVISVLSIIVSAATFYLLNKPATAVSETTATEVGIADAQPAGEQAQAGAQESVAQDNAGASENNNGNAAGTEAAADNAQAGTETAAGTAGVTETAAQTTETANTTDTTDTAETKTETAKAKSDAAGTVTFTAEYVDENGNKLRDSEPLSVSDSLDLTVSPADIEGYSFVRAQIDGTEARSITRLQASSEVSTSIAVSDDEDAAAADKSEDSAAAVQQTGDDNSSAAAQQSGSGDAANDKTAASSTQSTASGHGAAAYVYTAADGTQKELAGDTTVTMIYTSDAVKLKATLVDEFGTEIDSSRYTKIDLPAPDKDGMIVLDDPADAPYKDVKVNKGLFKTVKYTYVKATVDGTDVKAIRVNSRTAEETDTAKTEDTTSDKAARYSYTADGTAWKDITADSVVTMVYSSGTKTEYTYEDENVEVTARLQKAGAVPDDAEFRVIQIKAGKAFDAYITALNDADKDKPEDQRIEHTADNTLLYDVSFITKETDSDGKPTGKETEFEPLDGTVQVSFEFKKNQLTDIGAAAPDSLSVSHLVLNDDVKAKADTTLEAAQKADASDIKVDDMKIDSASVDGTQSLDITADSFSTFAVMANNDVNNTYTTKSVNYQKVLGDALEYGIVADKYDASGSHTETNFAVKDFAGGQVVEVDLSNGADIPFIAGDISYGTLRLGNKTDSNNVDVYLQDKDVGNVSSDNKNIKINKIVKSETELGSMVSGMQEHVSSASKTLAGLTQTTGWTYKDNTIDTTAIDDNVTIVINIDYSAKWSDITNEIEKCPTIKKKANQNIVFNVFRSDLKELREYKVTVGNDSIKTNDQTNSGKDSDCNKLLDSMVLQHIIWNVTNSNDIELQDTAGVFLLPNSGKTTVRNSAGWAVSNGTIYSGGEWHFIYHERQYTSVGNTLIKATKTLTGGTLTAGEFTFALSAANDRTTAPLETAVNDADGNIRFAGLNYTEDDVGKSQTVTKKYYVYEVIPAGASCTTVNGQAVYTKDNIQYDPTIYPVTVTLKDDGNGNITATPDMDASQLTFNNTYAPGYIKVTKIAGVAGSIDANAKFYFRVYDETAGAYCSVTGKYINADGSDGTAFTVPLGVIPLSVGQSVLINGYQATDASDNAVIRPLELRHKYRITEVTDSGGNTEGAPSGYAVTYAVDENAVNSAEVTIVSAVTGNVTITNTPVGELTVKKVWLDENGSDASGSHTEPLGLELWQRIGDNGTWSRYSEDGETVYRITLDHANGWTATVKKLPVYASAGSKYEYCVKEPDSYSKTYSVVYSYNGREYKLSDEKTCSVTDDNGTSEKDPGYSMNVSGSTYGTVTITNRLIQTNILPTTGSSGTRPFMISGILLMASAAAGILLMLSRRRKKPPTG